MMLLLSIFKVIEDLLATNLCSLLEILSVQPTDGEKLNKFLVTLPGILCHMHKLFKCFYYYYCRPM